MFGTNKSSFFSKPSSSIFSNTEEEESMKRDNSDGIISCNSIPDSESEDSERESIDSEGEEENTIPKRILDIITPLNDKCPCDPCSCKCNHLSDKNPFKENVEKEKEKEEKSDLMRNKIKELEFKNETAILQKQYLDTKLSIEETIFNIMKMKKRIDNFRSNRTILMEYGVFFIMGYLFGCVITTNTSPQSFK